MHGADDGFFTGDPDWQPYLLCEYTDVPFQEETLDDRRRKTVTRGVVGIGRSDEYGFNTKRTEWVLTEYLDDEGTWSTRRSGPTPSTSTTTWRRTRPASSTSRRRPPRSRPSASGPLG